MLFKLIHYFHIQLYGQLTMLLVRNIFAAFQQQQHRKLLSSPLS